MQLVSGLGAVASVPGLFRDKSFLLALVAGPIFWFVFWQLQLWGLAPVFSPATGNQWLMFVVVYPVLEEWVFRGFIQSWLLRVTDTWKAPFPVSPANLGTSCLFALCHVVTHGSIWAGAVIFPSLVFGGFRERYGSTSPGILLHCFYNLGFLVFFLHA